jgi:hypothetical protein
MVVWSVVSCDGIFVSGYTDSTSLLSVWRSPFPYHLCLPSVSSLVYSNHPSVHALWLVSNQLPHETLLIPLVTVQWFTTEEQHMITTIWTMMFAIAGVVANLLGYAFYHIKGHDPLRGWQWMTITIAGISVLASGKSQFRLSLPD